MGGTKEMSASSLVPDMGKGYSKRGDESKGVPRMEDGECRERFERLRRGFRVGLWCDIDS
jgi:hypothetical protein